MAEAAASRGRRPMAVSRLARRSRMARVSDWVAPSSATRPGVARRGQGRPENEHATSAATTAATSVARPVQEAPR